MGFKKNNPGCNCCGCTIVTDSFDRADDTDIDTGSDAGWTEVSGAWAISSNTLQCTSAGIATCDTVHPDGDSTMLVEVDFQHGTSGSTCDVIVGWASSSDYYYVRYTVQGASGSIDIRRYNGFSHSSLSLASTITMNTATTYTAKVCVHELGQITAYLDDVVKAVCSPQTITGTKCGLGASGSGTATFDNFSFSKSRHTTDAESCPSCGALCSGCSPADVPATFKVVIAGTFTSGGTCDVANCGSVVGIYYPTWRSGCCWAIPLGFDVCHIVNPINTLGLKFATGTGSTTDIDVRIGYAVLGDVCNVTTALVWFKNDYADRECRNYTDLAIPYSAGSASCTGPGSTCTITAQ